MKLTELEISGCYLIELSTYKDTRGLFIKTFNLDFLSSTPIAKFNLQEEFYSVSKKNVLRGLHFQEEPAAHNKMVICISGKVLDFFVDIRKSSKTYGKLITLELDSEIPKMLYLPKGIAHGFLTISDSATLLYKTDYIYSSEHDKGINWSSVGLSFNDMELIISERDCSFPNIEEYESTFE
ncbi:dTDP-4-dehydrorhamnose 3,5-epimerase family protein [Vibrio cholerae]